MIKPLRIVEVKRDTYGGTYSTWELRDGDDNLLADIGNYYAFMRAWMDAPLGLFEVITLEDADEG